VNGLAQEFLGLVEFDVRLQTRAADLGDERLADLLLVVLDDADRALEDLPPGVRVGLGPFTLVTLGGTVGVVDLLGRGVGDGGELLVVVRNEVDDVP
jgi:hypothetical protein